MNRRLPVFVGSILLIYLLGYLHFKAIIGIFVVLSAWIPLWYVIPALPFPYLIYVMMFYGLDVIIASVLGFIVSIFVLGIAVFKVLSAKDAKNLPDTAETGDTYNAETLAEKRP